MKILEITRSYFPSIGGMEKFVFDRTMIYRSLGIEYEIISTSHSEKRIPGTNQIDDVKYIKSLTPLGITPSLPKVLRNDFDVLSVNQVGYFYSYMAIKLAFNKGKKIMITPHYFFHTDRYRLLKKIYSKTFVRKIFQKADVIICFTESEKKFWGIKFPFIKDKIKIIPHYYLAPQISIDTNNSIEKDFLFYLGRGDCNKRLDLLIAAYHQINTKVELWLTVDETELPEKTRKFILENNKIKLLGRISESDKIKLLANCSALILPTDFEAFGIVNFEASNFKKPLLLTDLHVFREILNNEGVIYFQNTIQDIKNKIELFLGLDDQEKIKMGLKNYENLRRYSFDQIKSNYEMLLTSLKPSQ